MNHCVEKLAITFILVIAAPQAFADWEMTGRVVIIGPLSARAITRVDDPDHDALVMRTDAILFEAGNKVDDDRDLCQYKTVCQSKAIDRTVCSNTDYCGRGGAEERLVSNTLIPIPFTRREWGGGLGPEPPVCKISGGGGGGGNQTNPR